MGPESVLLFVSPAASAAPERRHMSSTQPERVGAPLKLTSPAAVVAAAGGERIVRPAEFAARLGIGISTLYDWMSDPNGDGPPRPRQVGPRRAVGWPLSVVEEFIRSLPTVPAAPRASRRSRGAEG